MGWNDLLASLGLSRIAGGMVAPRRMPPDLEQSGLMGTAVVRGMVATGVSFAGGGIRNQVIRFDLEVHLSDSEPYPVSCDQAVPGLLIGAILPGSTVFVRVDPADRGRLAIDFSRIIGGGAAGGTPGAGGFTAGPTTESASSLLMAGVSGWGVVQQTFSVGPMRAPNGDPVLGLIMTVTYDNGTTVVSRNGQRIPTAHFAILVPGARLPIKGDPSIPDRVTIDWTAIPHP